MARLNKRSRAGTRRWNAHGFTVLELLVAIIIVLLLAIAAIVMLSRIEVWANVAQAKTEITQISMAVEMEKSDTGYYILNLADLGSPSPSALSGISNRTWNGPYLNGDFLVDPWGKDYSLTLIRDDSGTDTPTPVPANNQTHYLITSCGADKQPGGTGLNADIIWHSDYAGFKD